MNSSIEEKRFFLDRMVLYNGNAALRASWKVIRAALKYGLPAGIENPASSLMRQLAEREALCTGNFQNIIIDMFQMGSAHKKPTRILLWNAVATADCRRRPVRARGKKALCSCSLHPHVQLSGAGEAGFRTTAAQVYPAPQSKTLTTHIYSLRTWSPAQS